MILFQSMLERASKNNVQIDRGRGIANGSLMLVAGVSSLFLVTLCFDNLLLTYAANQELGLQQLPVSDPGAKIP